MKFWKVCSLLGIEVLLIVLLLPGSYAQSVWQRESGYILDHAGPETYEFILERGENWKNRVFYETGFYNAALNMLVPTEEEKAKSKGLENLGSLWFEYAGERLDALEDVFHLTAIRLALAVAWAPYILIIFIPALLDGWYTRRIRQTNFKYVSPVIHTYAMKMAWSIAAGGAILFLLPFPITPIYIPVALMLMSIAIGVALGNFQKRL